MFRTVRRRGVGFRSVSVECLSVPYVFSSRCVCYVHDVFYIFNCRVCRYDLCVLICDGNSVHAIAEYQRQFPNRRTPIRRVFTRVYQTLRDTGTLPGVRIAAERDVNEGVDEEGIVQMVQSSPRASTRRIARRLHVPLTRV